MNKTIAILGATGSIGIQALDVARASDYKVDLLTAHRDVDGMESAAREFLPRSVAMADSDAARELRVRLADTGIRVYSGEDGILEAIRESRSDTVINSILGMAGLMPTIETIKSGKRLALANKESLVIAGDIVTSLANARGVEIIPVDSEHSAIFQSLRSGRKEEIKRIILTASGGPFFGKTADELKTVTLADTLAHPTWKMGRKITVDSATMMNKGFEVIEAAHLFGVGAEQIEVVIHRESILHSAVEYIDNAVIGEFSLPDMRSCTKYAVDYPHRLAAVGESLDFTAVSKLSFAAPDYEVFPLLGLAKTAFRDGGGMSAVLNAADEVVVRAFLEERIGFLDIADIITKIYSLMPYAKEAKNLDEIISADREARIRAAELIK